MLCNVAATEIKKRKSTKFRISVSDNLIILVIWIWTLLILGIAEQQLKAGGCCLGPEQAIRATALSGCPLCMQEKPGELHLPTHMNLCTTGNGWLIEKKIQQEAGQRGERAGIKKGAKRAVQQGVPYPPNPIACNATVQAWIQILGIFIGKAT